MYVLERLYLISSAFYESNITQKKTHQLFCFVLAYAATLIYLPFLEDPSISLSDDISSNEICSITKWNIMLVNKYAFLLKYILNLPSCLSTSESLSDDSVSVGHFVAVIIDFKRFVEMHNSSFKQASSISSSAWVCKMIIWYYLKFLQNL